MLYIIVFLSCIFIAIMKYLEQCIPCSYTRIWNSVSKRNTCNKYTPLRTQFEKNNTASAEGLNIELYLDVLKVLHEMFNHMSHSNQYEANIKTIFTSLIYIYLYK